jgi:hypothetical protein
MFSTGKSSDLLGVSHYIIAIDKDLNATKTVWLRAVVVVEIGFCEADV